MSVKKKKTQDENIDEKNVDANTTENDDCNSQKSEDDLIEVKEKTDEEPIELKSEDTAEELQKKLLDKEKESQEYLDMLRHSIADFDNYRKRTNNVKESMYNDGFADAVKTILPVLDNLERAVNAGCEENSTLYEGLKMVVKMFYDILEKSGISEIKTEGEKFNPEYHNAVMHIEDEALEKNSITEVLQKGYMYKDKILRHSMVKVAN